MKLFWLILSGVCIVAAAVLLFLGQMDAAFVVAVLGMMAWFLNYRAQLKQIVVASEKQEQGNDLDDD